MQVHETPIFEIIFMTLTKDSFGKTNDTQGPEEYTKNTGNSCRDSHKHDMASKKT